MHASLHLALPFDGSPVYGSSANIEMTSCIWILTRLRKHVWNATHCLVHGPGCIGQSAHLWVPRLGTRYCFSPSPVTPPSRPPCLLPSVFPLIACDRPFPFPNSFLLSSKWWKKCLAFKLILWKSFFFLPQNGNTVGSERSLSPSYGDDGQLRHSPQSLTPGRVSNSSVISPFNFTWEDSALVKIPEEPRISQLKGQKPSEVTMGHHWALPPK